LTEEIQNRDINSLLRSSVVNLMLKKDLKCGDYPLTLKDANSETDDIKKRIALMLFENYSKITKRG